MTDLKLRLFDSKAGAVRDFVPREPGRVGIYVCGPTVQGAPHVGHLRSALVYDLLRHWLLTCGQAVTLVRNVTDIDDKVLERGEAEGKPWWQVAYRYEREFNVAYAQLGVLPPDYEPRATGHIGEMVELIEELISRGHAYRALDGSADVYFATESWPRYGELTRQSPADMASQGEGAGLVGDSAGLGAGSNAAPSAAAKRNPNDFALWKASKPGEPVSASWVAPFGRGRPGWHIECSAMAVRYLGTAFDIHGGGLDLRFPHHENELAQSSAAGHEFAGFWLHNGLVNVAGQKMSKSLGNSVYAADLLAEHDPRVVRYLLTSAHYRSVLDLSEKALADAAAALQRIDGFLVRAQQRFAPTKWREADNGDFGTLESLPLEFVEAMNEDLNVPKALAVLHDHVRAGNAALDSADPTSALADSNAVASMVRVLGLDFVLPAAATNEALDNLLTTLIEQRNLARSNKDFARADAIRDLLSAGGITLEDTPDGTNWSIN